MRLTFLCLLASILFPAVTLAQSPTDAPVFQSTPLESKFKFDVETSVPIKGAFNKWDATLTFTSPELATGALNIKIQADSVDTGSEMKNEKLKSKDFFDVKNNPNITFNSTKIVQTGHDTFRADGDLTLHGVTKREKLSLKVTGVGTGSGTIEGTMAFDPKEYGMNSGIPSIKIADRVEVSFVFKSKRVSGPPVVLEQ
jgi:polyisoprenoid-binding protein YceI